MVHDICVPLHRATGLSAPCLTVDTRRGVAVVPNPRGDGEVLLVPTVRVTGVEDPALLRPGAPDYWVDAWNARRFLARRAGRDRLPDEDVAMAVNAVPGRSQDQLHIHVDCVRADVKTTLAAAAPGLDDRWRPLVVRGGEWRARRLRASDTPEPDPFLLLAQGVPEAATAMGEWTLVVAGLEETAGGGFVVLARRADAGYAGHGEFLLDKRCAVLATG